MALHRPKGLPESFWLPVIAIEAEARIELVTKLSPTYVDDRTATAVAVRYASKVAEGFVRQACEAAKVSEFPLENLDQAVEHFVDVLLHHAYFGINHPRIVQNWPLGRSSRFEYQLKPLVMIQPWHRRYLEEVPKILAAILKPELALNQLAEKRRSFVQPRLVALGMNVTGWAEKAGVDPTVAYDYMNGKSNPRAESRRVLAEALGVKPNELP